jgi:hypothetical protein
MGTVSARIQAIQQQAADRARLEGEAQRLADQTAASKAKRLSTAGLRAAGMENTDNPLLQMIWGDVAAYNATWKHPSGLSPEAAFNQVKVLDVIFSRTIDYVTTKWSKDPIVDAGTKRVLRWNALKVLLEEVSRETEAFGLRRITGTSDFRSISGTQRNYWLERMDQKHRPGYFLSPLFATWLQDKPAKPDGKPMSFFDWLSSPAGTAAMAVVDPDSRTRNQTVQGYDSNGDALWRKTLNFDRSSGQLKRPTDRIFDTTNRRTEFSQHGWAIWVCSGKIPGPNGRFQNFIFSYTHDAGKFHHSTFLGGAPVMAAGEWIVDRGRVKAITAKSGHYKPSPDDLARFVAAFPQIPADAIIRPDLSDRTRGPGKVLFYRVGDFRSAGLKARPLKRNQVIAAIPGWANKDMLEIHASTTTISTKMVDLLPI